MAFFVGSVYAADYPTKPITSQAHFPAGGISDVGAHIVGPSRRRIWEILAHAASIINHQVLPVGGINIVLPRITPPGLIEKEYLPQFIRTGKGFSWAIGNMA